MAVVKSKEEKINLKTGNLYLIHESAGYRKNATGRKDVSPPEIKIHKPTVQDGAGIWELIRETDVLDLNSAYCYLMLGKYFSDTCLVTEYEQKIVGFISAFLLPQDPEVVFVWQVAVAGSMRKKGLGIMLLKELLKRKACAKVRFLETTVTLSNIASQSLFCRLTRDTHSRLEITVCFPADLFPKGSHETEFLFRIGPLQRELIE
ncbi:MAG: hypothetical protein STSR0004_14660 [Peptococcaceae bacterium]